MSAITAVNGFIQGSAVAGPGRLERHIQERLAAREEAYRLRQELHRRLMAELEERLRRYDAVADRLTRDVIRPSVAVVAKHFDNATAPEGQDGRHSCALHFARTSRFPATAGLKLAVSRDGEAGSVMIEFTASIVPIFTDFRGDDRLVMPLDEVSTTRAAGWVEEKLAGFVDAYLQPEIPS
jgi:hypothetical protein